uniref:Uncharacterized protein n=1 Tax=Picea glauca TaxID=3330 RepID=A0A101LWQ8_PICGL|nr:hypothetical protein ABT39_MTgene1429 [Picea glauca]
MVGFWLSLLALPHPPYGQMREKSLARASNKFLSRWSSLLAHPHPPFEPVR